MGKRLNEGLSFPSEDNKKRNQSNKPNSFRNLTATAIAATAFSGLPKESNANPPAQPALGTVDDIYFDKDLTSTNPLAGAPILDLEQNTFTLERGVSNGGEIELNSDYKVIVTGNRKVIEIVNRTTGITEYSTQSTSSLNTLNPLTHVGNGYVVIRSYPYAQLININDLGTPNFQFRQLSESWYGYPTHYNTHPTTGDVVGITLSKGGNDVFFFSYNLGNFTATHPIANSGLVSDDAFKRANMMDVNGVFQGLASNSSVMPDGNIYFAVTHDNVTAQQYINPEPLPSQPARPEIQAPASIRLNADNLRGGPEPFTLQVRVTNVPANHLVAFKIDQAQFNMIPRGDDLYERDFTDAELRLVNSSGEFDETGSVVIVDNNGMLLEDENGTPVSQDIQTSVDISAPNQLSYNINGAYSETMGNIDVNVLESDSMPMDVTVDIIDNMPAEGKVFLASMPIDLQTYSAMSSEEQQNFLNGKLAINKENQSISLEGGYIQEINLDSNVAFLQGLEGGHLVVAIAFDSFSNNSEPSIQIIDVREKEMQNPDMGTPDMGEDMGMDAGVPDMGETDSGPDQPDAGEEIDAGTDKPDSGNQDVDMGETPEEPKDRIEDPTCSTTNNESPANTPLAIIAATLAAIGLRRKKDK